MYRLILILLCMLAGQNRGIAQTDAAAAYDQFLKLTEIFHGAEPFSCYAIVEVKYKNNPENTLRDTSRLIYRDRATYYKSKLVEHIEAPEGELIINHELKTASFQVSDSIKQIIQGDLGIKPDTELESLLDADFEKADLKAFNKYILNHCKVSRTSKDNLEEISFESKNVSQADFLSLKIRFDKNEKVRYYEYSVRDVYATDMQGKSRFRIVKTIYDNFKYDDVPNIPARLTDFLKWNGWTIQLIKYTNYKLSVL